MANFTTLAGEKRQIRELGLDPSTESGGGPASKSAGLRGDTEKNDAKPNKYNTQRKKDESLPDFRERLKKLRGGE